MSTAHTTNANGVTTVESTPREEAITLIFRALATAVDDDDPATDYSEVATNLLEELERRVIGMADGELIFCDPDIEPDFIEGGSFPNTPVQFVEMTADDELHIRKDT